MTERQEADGLIFANRGRVARDQDRERHGEFSVHGNARRKRFRTPPRRTGKRDEFDGSARGRLGHEWNVYRRLADLPDMSRLFLKDRLLFG